MTLDARQAAALLGWRAALGLDDSLVWTVGWTKRVLGGEDAGAVTREQVAEFESLRS